MGIVLRLRVVNSGDADVAAMIRAFVGPMAKAGADLRRAFEEGRTSNFLALLRSGEELAPADRALLADLLSGDLGRKAGRQTSKAPAKDARRRALDSYRARRTEQPKLRKEVVAQTVADEFGLTVDQVLALAKKGAPANT